MRRRVALRCANMYYVCALWCGWRPLETRIIPVRGWLAKYQSISALDGLSNRLARGTSLAMFGNNCAASTAMTPT